MTSCVACGTEVPPGARFCPTCGTSQAAVGEERRVVTVLFADIVGFTGLAERQDPEHVKHLVDRCFERLARDITAFGGVVDKIIGDAIVALFGAPVAHEDDAERAVRAGLRMQQTLAALARELDDAIEMRVGVNTGEVLVGSTSAGGDYTAMGDVMNTASRLQTMALPGQVLVGPATWAATREAIAYHSAGLLDARGREAPIEGWVADATLRPPGMRTRRGTSFVGRDDELAALLGAAALAVGHHRAQLALIVGEPGMGKTRLAQEAAAEVARRWDARVVEGRCVPYGEANVWWPVAEVLRAVLGVEADTEAPEARRTVRAAVEGLLPNVEADSVDRYATGLLHALGYQTPLRGGDRHRNRSEVTLALTVTLEAELRRGPLVVVLSDVHWAAEAVWVLLEHLLDELARQRLLVLLTARDLDGIEVPVGRHGLVVLQLDRLEDRAARELLRASGVELPAAAAAELVRRSGGNPFFLEELSALVTDRPTPERQELVAQLAEGRLGILPDNLRGLVAARLDSLPSDERSVLDDASVLGRSGPVEGLSKMAQERRGRESILAEVHALAAKDLFMVDGPRYEFRSDLVRDVAYAMLTKTDRAQRHHGIARYLEEHSGPVDELRSSVVARIAQHYRMAALLVAELRYVPGVDAREVRGRAMHWIEEVARRSAASGAHREAERWYGSGADLAPDEGERVKFLLGRAQVRCATHDIVGSRADLERIAALGYGDALLEARALLVAGDLDRKAGDLERAALRLADAEARFEALGAASERAAALRLVGLTELFRGNDAEAQAAIERSREVAAEAGDRRAEGWALQSLAWHAFLGGFVTRARGYLAQASEIFAALDDRSGLAWVQGLEAWVAFHLGEWDQARALIDAVLPETRRRGDRWAEGVMLNLLASLELWSGRPSVAVEVGRSAVEVAEAIENAPLAAQSRCTTGHALVAVGRVAEGVALLDDAYVLATRSDDRESRWTTVVANVASAARIGEPERAIRWASRFDSDHGDADVVGETDLVASLALALLQRGAVDEAASQLAPLLHEGTDGSPVHPFALAVGAIVAAAQGEAAVAQERAAGVLQGHSTYLDRIMALLARAAVQSRSDDAAGRGATLAQARAEADATEDRVAPLLVELAAGTMGAGPLDEAEAGLRGMGLEPAAWRRALELAASAGAVAC